MIILRWIALGILLYFVYQEVGTATFYLYCYFVLVTEFHAKYINMLYDRFMSLKTFQRRKTDAERKG